MSLGLVSPLSRQRHGKQMNREIEERMQGMNEIKIEKYLSYYTCPDCGHQYHLFRTDKTIMPCPKCHRKKWDVKDDHPDISLERMNGLKERIFKQ